MQPSSSRERREEVEDVFSFSRAAVAGIAAGGGGNLRRAAATAVGFRRAAMTERKKFK